MQDDLVTTDGVTAVLLAAGFGSRFGGDTHKLLARLRGKRIIDWSLGAVLDAGFTRVVVVQGAIDLAIPHPDTGNLTVVTNPHPEDGQAGSLQMAIALARETGADAVVVGLADQPFISPAAWRAVAHSTSPIAVATYDSERGNPVRLGREVWDLLPESGDFGARHLISRRPELVEEVPCTGSPSDIDTLEDLRTWNSTTASP
jgi:CTP:molybdopterin cytidylyltransferase MocA